MAEELKEKRDGAIESLRSALAEMASEDGLMSFIGGHGLQSRVFEFSWQSDDLAINFRLPFARVLSDEESQQLDAARINAAIRIAILLLVSSAGGSLLRDGEASLSISADQSGISYAIMGEDGEEVDSGESFEPLIARLDASLPGGGEEKVTIIWP